MLQLSILLRPFVRSQPLHKRYFRPTYASACISACQFAESAQLAQRSLDTYGDMNVLSVLHEGVLCCFVLSCFPDFPVLSSLVASSRVSPIVMSNPGLTALLVHTPVRSRVFRTRVPASPAAIYVTWASSENSPPRLILCLLQIGGDVSKSGAPRPPVRPALLRQPPASLQSQVYRPACTLPGHFQGLRGQVLCQQRRDTAACQQESSGSKRCGCSCQAHILQAVCGR